MKDAPGDYIKINSGLGETDPYNIVVIPIVFEEEVSAVVELASLQPFTEMQLTLFDQLSENFGIVLNSILSGMRTEELLKQSQSMGEELQSQQEELQQTNEELEEKARQLSEQNSEVERKNREVEDARLALEEKAEQLALTSKYKSEFLANMSHELRTPLNSLLILAQILESNENRRLDEKQVEYAHTIHASGEELLNLINDILDLSKIEAGSMGITVDTLRFDDVQTGLERSFSALAGEKGLAFTISAADSLPASMRTDQKRLQQVLKNLLSNSLKFTDTGSVTLAIAPAEGGWDPLNETLNRADGVIGFTVTDSGIGIPADKQRLIFEAFQQADGTTSRKYGGTGLGLSISREIARILGGEIRLMSSVPGQGSEFALFLPVDIDVVTEGSDATAEHVREMPMTATADTVAGPVAQPVVHAPGRAHAPSQVPDDRGAIESGDRVVLIIEDDSAFALLLLDTARNNGFKGLVALDGKTGLALASEYVPDAITLDMALPDMQGWAVLDRLKHMPETRHIPVHIVTVEADWQRAIRMGAHAYFNKPVEHGELKGLFEGMAGFLEREFRNLLVIEDDAVQQQAITALIGGGDVKTTAVASGAEALAALKKDRYDCIILDLGLPDTDGFTFLEKLGKSRKYNRIPVIIYTGKQLSPEQETRLRQYSRTIIMKDADSPARLLDETALFLHRVERNLPEDKRELIRQVNAKDPVFAGKTVLVVDDDVRNIFALTSVLERQNMNVIYAENGREGIEKLKGDGSVKIVLMDIMMPEMDGYETMKEIRKRTEFKKLPIIALTAKAMKGDREKCLAAGASDYITKPVDTEQLMSLMRVWLYA